MSNDNPQRPPAISADFPFAVRDVQVHGARMAYIDEGSGDPIVFLHSNPTSSYLWRNVIPHVRSVGRCIAPDLIGMGRSDKPDIGYRFVDHALYIDGFLEALGLDRITFVVHDWGSALGFDWAMRHESRVRGLAFMEAILGPVPSWEQFTPQGREIFKKLRTPGVGETMVLDHNMFVEQLLPGSVVRSLSPAEMQHLSRAVRRAHRAQADAGVAARDSDRRRARGCRHGRVALSLRLVPVAAAEAAVYRRAGHARASAVGGVVPCEPTQARRHRARPRIALRARRSSARDRRAHRGLGAPYARGLNAIARLEAFIERHRKAFE